MHVNFSVLIHTSRNSPLQLAKRRDYLTAEKVGGRYDGSSMYWRKEAMQTANPYMLIFICKK